MKFRKGNKIRYGQDRGYFRGIPDGVDFHAEFVAKHLVRLTAEGFGKLDPPGFYGNGGLYTTDRHVGRRARGRDWR